MGLKIRGHQGEATAQQRRRRTKIGGGGEEKGRGMKLGIGENWERREGEGFISFHLGLKLFY